ncbi:MAG: ABC transporter ATP-binding protein [Pseudonocardia sp.]|nr:ABC transporter ATP-binding protein [Pseudonocardia sp.]
MSLLAVENLSVAFAERRSWSTVVDDVSFEVAAGTTLGLVGESGSGKTVTALSIMGLTRAQGARVSGAVRFDGQDLAVLDEDALADIRGARIGMVFQQASRTLDPAFTVGEQIAETVRRHTGASRRDAWDRAVEMLQRVHIPRPVERALQYPHEFSGGMAQRVVIAMALSCSPAMVIADEPTTALDVTVQARILELLRELQDDTGVAIVLISHDLGVIAEMADRVAVMYAGQIVEQAPIEELFVGPRHPYSSGLMGAIPVVGQGRRLVDIPGVVPPPQSFPAGCRFHPRCPHAEPGRCDAAPPPLERVDAHEVRCVRTGELSLPGVLVPEVQP